MCEKNEIRVRFRTFAVSTCGYKRNGAGVSEVGHRATLVHTLNEKTAGQFAEYLLSTNFPVTQGWIHVGFNIATPDDTMQFPDIKGNPNN